MPAPALPRLASIDRSQLLLHTVDVERMIDEDHSARSIWHLVGRLSLSLYYAKIAALEGRAGRDHTAPQLLISLWLYAYSQGISSAREVARQCAFEPGLAWLCGLQPISHRTLSGFRSDHKEALENLFVQVVGMLSAEGLITMQRVTLDGTKIKANASGNTFRRKKGGDRKAVTKGGDRRDVTHESVPGKFLSSAWVAITSFLSPRASSLRPPRHCSMAAVKMHNINFS